MSYQLAGYYFQLLHFILISLILRRADGLSDNILLVVR
jgi:hypothetical protein